MTSQESEDANKWTVQLVDGSKVDARAAKVVYQTLETIISNDSEGFEKLLRYARGEGRKQDIPMLARTVFFAGSDSVSSRLSPVPMTNTQDESPFWQIAKSMLKCCTLNTREGYVIKDPFAADEKTTGLLEELDTRTDEFFRRLIRDRRERDDEGPSLN